MLAGNTAVWTVAPLAFCAAMLAQTQAPASPADTRAGRVQQERVEKQKHLVPDKEHPIEVAIERVTDRDVLPGRLFFGRNGFGISVGNLRSGSGFGFGPRYYRRDLAGERVIWENSLTASFRKFWAVQTRLTLPSPGGAPFNLQFLARHADAPSVNYFGPGSGSRRDEKTNYRREDNVFTGRLEVPLQSQSTVAGFYSGINLVNIGAGQGSTPSTDLQFAPQAAPGLRRQSNYLFNGPFVTFDLRDWPGNPHKGSLIDASYLYYWDYDHRQYSFRRLNVQLEHYIPFLNETRVLALRARTDLSFVPQGSTIPFFLQSTLGGPDDLRGFERFRYHDNNSLILNAEYRFEVATPLDIALFVDAGNVFRRPGLIGFRNMQEAGGIGFRFKTRDHVVLRFDTGFSSEGVRVWLQFSNAFDLLPLFR
ncbi:MAG TPA: BamA/TamA family outer membrane protein [Bryobacteraceae bacterium]|nr:BamA/TamA family outer membrane protein [Bryobacteraceae bacterium]